MNNTKDTLELTVRHPDGINIPGLCGFNMETVKLDLLKIYPFNEIFNCRYEIQHRIDLGHMLVTFNKFPITNIKDWMVIASRLQRQEVRVANYEIDNYSINRESKSNHVTVKSNPNKPKSTNPIMNEDIFDSAKDLKDTAKNVPANVPRTISKRPDIFSNRIDLDIDNSFE
jgi:hypothetical protein